MKNWTIVLLAAAVVILSVRFIAASKDNKVDESGENAAIENIMTRSSVRSYTDRAISKDTIEKILRAGMASPTAADKRPWAFMVIEEGEKKQELADSLPYAKMADQAPLLIVVCGDMEKALEGEGRDFWIQDCSAVTENVLLAAHALGLGAVWTGVHPAADRERTIRNVLQLPDNLIPLSMVCIGYPAAPATPKDKWDPSVVKYY